MNGRRIGAFALDYLITSVICCILFMIFIIGPTLLRLNVPVNSIVLRALCSTYAAVMYLVLRDLPKKGSVGKRVTKLKIVDSRTNQEAKPVQKFVRNIFWLAGPLEMIVYLFSQKRIGDMVAKTTVVQA